MAKEDSTLYLDHARVDMGHCLADGLFLPTLQRVNGELQKLDLRYPCGDQYVLWWRNFEALDVADLCVFLALHRIANECVRRTVIDKDADSELAKDVRSQLSLNQISASQNCIMIETTLTEIARIVGIEDGQNTLNNIMRSLVRMSSTTLALYKDEDMTGRFWQAQLIMFQRVKHKRLTVGFNPRLAQAVLQGSRTYIDMREFRTIKNKVAKRLYVWLSAWANITHASSINLDRLVPHVWGTRAEDLTSMTLRNRRRALRAAIADIAALNGWICSIDPSTQLVRVQKPKFVR